MYANLNQNPGRVYCPTIITSCIEQTPDCRLLSENVGGWYCPSSWNLWDDAADFPYVVVVVVVVVMWPCGIHDQCLDFDPRNAHASTFQHTEALQNPQAQST